VNRDKFTYNCAASNLNIGLFTFKFQRLGSSPYGGVLKYMTILTDGNIRFDNHMGTDNGSGSDRHILFDNGIWPNFHISVQVGL